MPPPDDAGLYQLLIELPQPLRRRVGALGEVDFAAGWWVYTGSMRRGLSHRLARHCAATKPLRWHIDYLTVAAGVAAVRTYPLELGECALHQRLLAAGALELVAGFGSSDCRCRAHLAWLPTGREEWDMISLYLQVSEPVPSPSGSEPVPSPSGRGLG